MSNTVRLIITAIAVAAVVVVTIISGIERALPLVVVALAALLMPVPGARRQREHHDST